MGCWGYEIFEDDYALDLKGEFEDLLNEGLSPLEATQKMIKENDYMLDDKEDDDYPIFYLVIASLQLENHCLQEHVKKEVLHIIENDIGIDGWEEAGEEEFNERKKVLENLKKQIIQI